MRLYFVLLIAIFSSASHADITCDYGGSTYPPADACQAYQAVGWPNSSIITYNFLGWSYDNTLPSDHVGPRNVDCSFQGIPSDPIDPTMPPFTHSLSCSSAAVCTSGVTENHIIEQGPLITSVTSGCFSGCTASLTATSTIWQDASDQLYTEGTFTLNGSSCSSGESEVGPLSGVTVYDSSTDNPNTPTDTLEAGEIGAGQWAATYPNGTCKDANGNRLSTALAACQSVVAAEASHIADPAIWPFRFLSVAGDKAQDYGPVELDCTYGTTNSFNYVDSNSGELIPFPNGVTSHAYTTCSTNDCYNSNGVCEGDSNGGSGGDGVDGEERTVSGGHDCSTPFVCSGDEIDCANLELEWRKMCPSLDEFSENQILSMLGLDGIDRTSLFSGVFDIGGLDMEGFFTSNQTCPTFDSFYVLGVELNWNVLPMCDIAQILGVLVLISGFLHSMKILIGAM